jgi:hypothetical protein
MPRPCSICQNPQRLDIERVHLQGTALRSISERFSVSLSALSRHFGKHLAPRLAAIQNGSVDASNTDLAEVLVARDLGRIKEDASLRDYAVKDLDRLEAMLADDMRNNNGSAVLQIIRTRYYLMEKSGLSAHIGLPIKYGSATSDNPVVAAFARQERLRKIVVAAAMKFNQLADLDTEIDSADL